MMYSKQDCIDALIKARKSLGHSPSYREYERWAKKVDYPSGATIKNRYGFNELKDQIYMEKYKNNDKQYEMPNEISMSTDKWDSLPPSEQRRLVNVSYVARRKIESGCVECGYDKHSQSLDYHHENPKTKSDRVSNLTSKTRECIDKEIEKCSVICANCHRKKSESFLSI